MPYDNEFPHRVASTRSSLGLTQADLASQVGVVQRQIAAYEGGESKPRRGVLMRLAESLGTTTEWLMEGIGEKPNPRKFSPTKSVRQIPIIKMDDVEKWMIDLDDNGNYIQGLYPTSCHLSHAAFAIKMDDPAMAFSNPYGYGFPLGCIVVFDPTVSEEDNDFVLALFPDGRKMFRQIFADLFHTQLTPLNDKYRSFNVPNGSPKYPGDPADVTLIPAVLVEVMLPSSERINS